MRVDGVAVQTAVVVVALSGCQVLEETSNERVVVGHADSFVDVDDDLETSSALSPSDLDAALALAPFAISIDPFAKTEFSVTSAVYDEPVFENGVLVGLRYQYTTRGHISWMPDGATMLYGCIDGRFQLRLHPETQQVYYHEWYGFSGFRVENFNPDHMSVDDDGVLNVDGAFGTTFANTFDLEAPAFRLEPVYDEETGLVVDVRYVGPVKELTDVSGMLSGVTQDVRFDVATSNLVMQDAHDGNYPRIDDVPFRASSESGLPSDDGDILVSPFLLITNMLPVEAEYFGHEPQFILGVRTGIVAKDIETKTFSSSMTRMLTPFRPLERIESTAENPRFLRGQEASIFTLNGNDSDGTGVAGYFVSYHSAEENLANGNSDGRIFCSVTRSLDPSVGWEPPISCHNVHAELSPYQLADGRTLADHLPLARKPYAAPDGTPYPAEFHLAGAYPWISFDGSTLYLINNRVREWTTSTSGGLVYGDGPTRAAVTTFGPDLLTENGTHFKQRIVQGLYHARRAESKFITTSPGRSGPYQWHLNTTTNVDAAFPITDSLHSTLVRANPMSNGGPVGHTSKHRFAEDFSLLREVFAEGDDVDERAGVLAYLPMDERYTVVDMPYQWGDKGVNLVENQTGNIVSDRYATFTGGATFPQEYKEAQGVHEHDADINVGKWGQAVLLPGAGHFTVVDETVPAPSATFTVSTWVKKLPNHLGGQVVALADFSNTDIFFAALSDLTAFGLVVELTVGNSEVPVSLIAPLSVANDAWVHLAARRRAEGPLELLVDGTVVSTLALPSGYPVVFDNSTLTVGFSPGVPPIAAANGELAGLLVDELFLARFAVTDAQMNVLTFKRRDRAPPPEKLVAAISFPLGLDAVHARVPSENPLDDGAQKKIDLGRDLFHDASLSKDKSVACATCHVEDLAFTDGKPRAVGVFGHVGKRNTPSIQNALFRSRFFWDGRAHSVEDQVLLPFVNPIEMGLTSHKELVALIHNDANGRGYLDRFKTVFGAKPSTENIALALASYVRSEVRGNSRVDQYRAGKKSALDDVEARGLSVFAGKGRCIACHRLEGAFGAPELETFLVDTGLVASEDDVGNGYREFTVPSLRDVSKTAPYFHDGSVKTLVEVISLYNVGAQFQGLRTSPETSRPLGLDDDEQHALHMFLLALDSNTN